MSADISKMYRQVLIKPEERSLQKILWRYEPTDNISTFSLNTVTYGNAAASFLAVRCLHQLAIDNSNKFPKACSIIQKDFYVDDLLTGTDDPEEAVVLCKQISEILEQGCFPLRKWLSNYPKILSDLENLAEANMILPLGDSETSKTLGLFWVAKKDVLTFNVSLHIPNVCWVRITMIKDLLQIIWLKKLNWDDPVPETIQNSWLHFHEKLPILNQITIPRHVICNKPVSIELHGFSDASEKAYGASIYIRSEDNNGLIITRLLCSKAKVAPIKTLTIPRLELQAALVLAKLIHKVIQSLTISVNQIVFWSDSSIVLSWLQTAPNTLKIFVANRVVQILELMPNCPWYYINSEQNPADLISRGMSPDDISEATLWWNGPSWLCEKQECWPMQSIQFLKQVPELKAKNSTCLVVKNREKFSINNYSDLNKLVRIVAYCLRFKFNCLNKRENRNLGLISAQERQQALNVLIKISQEEFYCQEINDLKLKGCLEGNSTLISLAPYLDDNFILRVSGRLHMSALQYNEKHPIILSQKAHLTLLIFRDAHLNLLHGGVQQMLCHVRLNYWPIKARYLAKRVVNECITCFRAKPKNNYPQMGRLPSARVTQAFPFQNTGVDYAGPFIIKNRKGRGANSSKCYLALFICLAVKAVHIEIVTDLSTEAFLASLRRFIPRRGCPDNMYSDNATNFVGTDRELGRWLEEIQQNSDKILNGMAIRGINWHFIPPRAPHFGGLWKSSVKRAKFHLKRILLNNSLTFEEMYTLTCQIEAILKSRPLTPLSDDVTDLQPLTPAHFLLGKSLTAVPDANVLEVNPGRLPSFKRVQQMTQGFWQRWKHEYLQQLNPRKKWRTNSTTSVAVGDLVLLEEENQPPLCWPMGRINEVFPGPDGVIRVATVQTTRGIYKRSVTKLYPLPKAEDLNFSV